MGDEDGSPREAHRAQFQSLLYTQIKFFLIHLINCKRGMFYVYSLKNFMATIQG